MGKSRTCDPTAGFSMDLVTTGLCRLYTIDGEQLVPNLDAKQKLPACPITLAPFEDPVLLEDGFVYEQAAITQWLERNLNAPCTNMELRSLRVLRLEPFRVVVNMFLKSKLGWRAQLVKAEGEALCSSIPLAVRCSRLERSIASCTAEALDLNMGLEAARCTAKRLRAELLCRQELESVRVQRAVRCWLARRQSRRLEKVRALQALRAALRIQRWWRDHKKKIVKRAKRQRLRKKKKSVSKAAQSEPSRDQPDPESRDQPEPESRDQPDPEATRRTFYYWSTATNVVSVDRPAGSSRGAGSSLMVVPIKVFTRPPPGWLTFTDRRAHPCFLDEETGEIAWASPEGAKILDGEDIIPPGWGTRIDDHDLVYYCHNETREAWIPPCNMMSRLVPPFVMPRPVRRIRGQPVAVTAGFP